MASNSGKARTYSLRERLYYAVVPFRYRYHRIFSETFDFLMSSQSAPRQKILDYQHMQLKDLLSYAYAHVPYYTRIFDERGLKPGDIQTTADLTKLPILTKKLIIENRAQLISTAYQGKTVTFKTSGSTGERLEFAGEDSMYKKEAAFVLRAFRSHGGRLYDRPSIWLRRYVPKKEGDPLWYYDYELKRLYMSPYHLTKDNVREYVDAMNRSKSDMLVTYPSSAYILACLLEEQGLRLPYIKSVHVASEMVLDHWKATVERVLGVPMKAHYGQTERVAFMYQPLETDCYVDNLEYGLTEFIPNGRGDHDIVATGFLNRVMPLIRYQTGDTSDLNEPDTRSVGLPISVKKITGRSDDILVAASGNKLPGVNFYTMMYKIDGVKMFQLIQRQLGHVLVRLVLERGRNADEAKREIVENLQSRLGSIDIDFELVENIERDPRTQKIRCIQSSVL